MIPSAGDGRPKWTLPVIALRDLQEFVNPDIVPSDYRSVIESRRESLKARANPR